MKLGRKRAFWNGDQTVVVGVCCIFCLLCLSLWWDSLRKVTDVFQDVGLKSFLLVAFC